jgi:hypothetical protein
MLRPMARVSTIPNLGPATEAAFVRAGVDTAEQVRALGPDAAYARLLANGERPHFIGYYVLVMGLMGRPWNDCRGAEKAALRARFDALVAGTVPGPGAPGPELRQALDALGVLPARQNWPGGDRRGPDGAGRARS